VLKGYSMSRKLIALILISTITCSLLSGCGSMINVGAKEAPDDDNVCMMNFFGRVYYKFQED
jgi:hypothetical protein